MRGKVPVTGKGHTNTNNNETGAQPQAPLGRHPLSTQGKGCPGLFLCAVCCCRVLVVSTWSSWPLKTHKGSERKNDKIVKCRRHNLTMEMQLMRDFTRRSETHRTWLQTASDPSESQNTLFWTSLWIAHCQTGFLCKCFHPTRVG